MEPAAPSVRTSNHPGGVPETEALIDYCWRPRCRKPIQRTAGPGRRKEYCSDICRRTAAKELRQVRARLTHFEELVQKLRIDVAAFGKSDSDETADEELTLSLDARQTAENAVRRALGALVFANPDEPAVRELRMLCDAVAPIVLPARMAG
jgi:hypothetical protein